MLYFSNPRRQGILEIFRAASLCDRILALLAPSKHQLKIIIYIKLFLFENIHGQIRKSRFINFKIFYMYTE
jgi:hypothetical protein